MTPHPKSDKPRQVDPIGTCVFLLEIVCSSSRAAMGRIEIQLFRWPNNLLLVVFGVLIIVFCVVQVWQGEAATIPPTNLQKQKHEIQARICISSGRILLHYGLLHSDLVPSNQGRVRHELGHHVCPYDP